MKNNEHIKLNKKTKIFILAPSNTATGGPEALHQLAYVLKNKLKLKVFMVYLPKNKDPVHGNYKHYSINSADNIEDISENILIVPEYYKILHQSKNYKKIQKILWWLSIDNYIVDRFRFKNTKFLRSMIKLPYNIISFFNFITFNIFGLLTLSDYLKFINIFFKLSKHKELLDFKLHLTQSTYAYNYIKKNFNNCNFLSDYTDSSLIKKVKKKILEKKKNIVCFNPSKANYYFYRVAKNNKKVNFFPIVNMSKIQAYNLLNRSKIYIDLGTHPGKDRLPREAALLDNCIITNKKGSANNSSDVFIPDDYKFKEHFFNIFNINKKINFILKNYEKEILNFEQYKKKIIKEKKVFDYEIKKIFKK